MNIFISADDKFILPTRVMLISFFVNNKQEPHNIYFLYSAVSDENLSTLKKLVNSYGSHLHPVLIQESDFEGFKCKNEYPLLVYYRLLVAHILPGNEDRALWMDVDLIVNGPIDSFYYQDFGENLLVACPDCDTPVRMEQLGCLRGSTYINAGVVLYNAAAMRGYMLSDFYAYYKAHEEYILMQDQDILNGMFTGKIKVWPDSLYNYYAPSGYACKDFCYRLWSAEVKIVHYIGKHKPWMCTFAHPAGALWDKYFVLTNGMSQVKSVGYCMKKKFMRFFQCKFIFPLRLLHGKLNNKLR